MTTWPFVVPEFDLVVARRRDARTSFTEEDALREPFWNRGDDASLREDVRFRPTSWGRWVLHDQAIANESLFERLVEMGGRDLELEEALAPSDGRGGCRHVVCVGDERLVVQKGRVRLSASQLSDLPRLEDASAIEQFATHLPVYSLRAVAASMPAGGWGPRALDEVPDLLGWVRVDLASRTDRRRLFLARIVGHSMEGGRPELRDGRYALFSIAEGSLDDEPIVLVRGAFHDPETGSYAVKRLRTVKVPDGESEIRLVSHNPDRTRYPDIVLDPSRADAVRVVARLVSPLDEVRFDRAPKRTTRPGERDLRSKQGIADVLAKLEARLATLFHEPNLIPGEPEADAPGARWRSRLTLTDDGLRVSLSPLEGLPLEARWVEVEGAETSLRANNARVHPSAVPVAPRTASYVVRIDGVEGPWEAAASRLELPGLSESTATVFIAGARDVWPRVFSETLSAGSVMRLVIPPSLETISLDGFERRSLGGGWSVVELHVPEIVPTALQDSLRALGLDVGRSTLSLQIVGSFPRRIEETPVGATLPVWRTGDVVTMSLTSSTRLGADRGRLFVLGPGGLHTVVLPEGSRWVTSLADLPPGRYLTRALTVSTDAPPAELVFEVRDDAAGLWPAPTASVRLDEELLGVPTPEARDLGGWGDPWPLQASAPPFWALDGRWTTVSSARLERLFADEEGRFDLTPWVPALGPDLRAARSARLDLDLGAFGLATLLHVCAPSQLTVRTEIAAHWESVGAMVKDPLEGVATLYESWFVPVLQLLGWNPPPAPDPSFGVAGVACARLLRASDPSGDMSMLAIASGSRFDEEATLKAIASAASRDRADTVILTDGVRWRQFDRRTKRWRRIVSLDEALTSETAFELFFLDFDAG